MSLITGNQRWRNRDRGDREIRLSGKNMCVSERPEKGEVAPSDRP